MHITKKFNQFEITAAIAPNATMSKIKPRREIISPVRAKPLGLRKHPIPERISPKNQNNHPIIGIQKMKSEINEIIKPAVPTPFEFLPF